MRIGIIEDEREALFRRYHRILNGNFDVFIALHRNFLGLDPDDERKDFIVATDEDKERLKRYGQEAGYYINLENIEVLQFPKGIECAIERIPSADIYFCDGLTGSKCFLVADYCGKDKTYINSGNPQIMREAKRQGIKVVDRPLEKILEIK